MTSTSLALNGQPLTLEELAAVAYEKLPVVLHPEAHQRMEASRAVVERYLAQGATVYGINTGFGKMSEVTIPPEQLADLQLNLVRSHACGIGESLPEAEIRGMMLLRANVLAKGTSGVRVLVAEHLLSDARKECMSRRASSRICRRQWRFGPTGTSCVGNDWRGRSFLSRQACCRTRCVSLRRVWSP